MALSGRCCLLLAAGRLLARGAGKLGPSAPLVRVLEFVSCVGPKTRLKRHVPLPCSLQSASRVRE